MSRSGWSHLTGVREILGERDRHKRANRRVVVGSALRVNSHDGARSIDAFYRGPQLAARCSAASDARSFRCRSIQWWTVLLETIARPRASRPRLSLTGITRARCNARKLASMSNGLTETEAGASSAWAPAFSERTRPQSRWLAMTASLATRFIPSNVELTSRTSNSR